MPLKTCSFRFEGVEFVFEIDDSERTISEAVENTGVWEANQLSLYRLLVPAHGVFVDIGANVGVNTIYLAKAIPGANVIAVEASAANFDVLQRNVAAAGVDVDLKRIAIADRDGEISFAGAGTNAKIATSGGDLVPCRTLDTLVSEAKLSQIDLIKIDVEGYSDMVLSASQKTLGMTKNLIMEFSIPDIAARFNESDEFIRTHFDGLIRTLKSRFSQLYYISRRFGLVHFSEARDLFEMVLIESRVGDILASDSSDYEHISEFGFAMKWISNLARENHLRLRQVADLQAALAQVRGS